MNLSAGAEASVQQAHRRRVVTYYKSASHLFTR